MSSGPTSLLDLKSQSPAQVESLFSRVRGLKVKKPEPVSRGESIALLFFEPSTRTRMSFESAAIRMGLGPLIFDGGTNTSLEKGETVEDSILNVAAMTPKFLVVRCGDPVDLAKLSRQVQVPIINAGWGIKGHPTQALLDAFTMSEEFEDLRGLRVLIVGDTRHSRVAASHIELLPGLGAELAVCGPADFMIHHEGIKVFDQLSAGLRWAQVVISLRVQFERHSTGTHLSTESYRDSFGLNSRVLRDFSNDGIVMHPGPINHGIEIETDVLSDPRCRVLNQVANGVFVREALLREMYAD